LAQEDQELTEYEHTFWQRMQDLTVKYQHAKSDHETMEQQIDMCMQQLAQLKRTYVYDDAFHISYDGHFGTINGFRLGRLPSQQVEWWEINAALGQVVLLLHTMARRCNFSFSKFKLHSNGSFSKMSKIDDPSNTYELYGSNDINIGRIFWNKRFNQALVMLLYCVNEFGTHAHTLDPNFKPPHAIGKDTIDQVSIKLQMSEVKVWTRALKYLLGNLKYLLAWTSKHQDH
jgi:beclin